MAKITNIVFFTLWILEGAPILRMIVKLVYLPEVFNVIGYLTDVTTLRRSSKTSERSSVLNNNCN